MNDLDDFISEMIKLEFNFIFGEVNSKKEPLTEKFRLAWVVIVDDREIAWVNSSMTKAYKDDNYERTDIELTDFSFERWCRGMDI